MMYRFGDNDEKKKAKGIKKSIIKCRLIFENYKDSLFNDKTILQSQLRFESNHHDVYTEEVDKIALNGNDDKKLLTFDRVSTYPYGTNAFKVCENEMLSKYKWSISITTLMKIKLNIIKTGHILPIIHTEY